MARLDQYARLINHSLTTAGQQFTVPTSNDHDDQTWLSTDLYIAEIGVNVTDNTVWVRTNNGIVQIGTSASSSGASGSSVFVFNSPHIQIGSTYSADSVSPIAGYYTDLGTSTYRWKDLYLGGSSTGICGINVNTGFILTEASNQGILSSGAATLVNNPPLIIGAATVSAGLTMDRTLALNSKDIYFQGSGDQRVMIASNGVIMGTSSDILIAGSNVIINNGVDNHVHLGPGYNRTNYHSNEVVAGGSFAIRGVADDGSTQYDRSDWITTQDLLRTTNALTTNIATIPWGVTGIGNVIQVKAYITGVKITDSTLVYAAEMMGVFSLDPTGTTSSMIGTPVVMETSSWSGVQPSCEMAADINNVYIKVTGRGSDTIQWICSYSRHNLINIS